MSLKEVTLGKTWGPHDAGTVLSVDPERLKSLKRDGLLEAPKKKSKKGVKKNA